MAMRNIRPKDEKGSESPVDLNIVREVSNSTNKRRCISSACLPCRKRKSKCDGATPFCSTCTAVYHTECVFDVESDHRRKAALKRDILALKEQNGALGVIIASIKTSSEAEVGDIIQHIRADEDLEGLADSLRKNVTLAESSELRSVEGELSCMVGRPSMDESGVMKHFGHTSNLGLVSSNASPPLTLQMSEEWTAATKDPNLVEHLMELYFCWSHPYYGLFSKQAFLADMAAGRNKYCSPLLVNALLAVACHYSDRPEVRRVQADTSTAGDYFFEEAKRLLNQDEKSCLTTIQALALMGLREPSCGRDSTGFAYAGRAVRMAIELGLHLTFEADSHKLSPTEMEVRRITFWGLFTYETAWSICIGRPTQLPTTAINLERPTILEQLDLKPWAPYTDYGLEDTSGQPNYTYTLQNHFISLSEIVNDTVFMFYAPRERFTSRKLLDFYKRYVQWFNNLPSSLRLRDVTLPHVLVLHMYYHTSVIHLFRAFLKVDLVRSDLSPRDVCTTAANEIANLLSTYRLTYSLRHSSILLSHLTLTANIIDLINLPDATAAQNLKLGVNVMREGSTNHSFFGRNLAILLALSKQWNIELPAEVNQAAYGLNGGPNINYMEEPNNAWPPTPNSTQNYPQGQEQYIRRTSAIEMPYCISSNGPKASAPASDLFWSPFPDQSLPLQAVQQNSPMDISALVEMQDGGWDQLSRDGFKMAHMNDSVLKPPGYVANGLSMQGGWSHG